MLCRGNLYICLCDRLLLQLKLGMVTTVKDSFVYRLKCLHNFILSLFILISPLSLSLPLFSPPLFTHSTTLLVSGGRSRLHLLDLGSCDVKVLGGGGGGGGKSRESSSPSSAPLCLSLSALGNVILALVNGSKHIPYK